jgi:hypothetical protein
VRIIALIKAATVALYSGVQADVNDVNIICMQAGNREYRELDLKVVGQTTQVVR